MFKYPLPNFPIWNEFGGNLEGPLINLCCNCFSSKSFQTPIFSKYTDIFIKRYGVMCILHLTFSKTSREIWRRLMYCGDLLSNIRTCMQYIGYLVDDGVEMKFGQETMCLDKATFVQKNHRLWYLEKIWLRFGTPKYLDIWTFEQIDELWQSPSGLTKKVATSIAMALSTFLSWPLCSPFDFTFLVGAPTWRSLLVRAVCHSFWSLHWQEVSTQEKSNQVCMFANDR